MNERSALRRARSGEREAFRLLLAQHQARVYGIALRLTGLPAEAIRLAQEACIELHAALPRIASPGHLTHWLLRETTRRVLLWVRQHNAAGDAMPDDPGDLPPRRLLLKLPPDARAMVLLRFQEGLDAGEIATMLDVAQPVVEHSLERSLDWMATQGDADAAEFEVQLRASLTAPDPGPEFTERVLAHTELRRSHRRTAFASGAGRARRRPVLIAALLVLVLAGMWLAVRLAGTDSGPGPELPVVQAVAPEESAAPEVAEPAAAMPMPADPEPAVPVRLRDAYPHYVVIAAPLRQQSLDQDAWAPVEAFHAALLEELARVSQLTLLVPGVTAPPLAGDQPADYLLTVTGLATASLAAGAEGFRITDMPRESGGLATAGELATGVLMLSGAGVEVMRRWPVQIRVLPVGQSNLGGYTTVVQVGADAAGLALQQVRALSDRLFPDLRARRLQAVIIRDDSLPSVERNRALSELLGTLSRSHGAGLDSPTVSTIVDYAGTLPADQRAQVWRSLRGIPHPELVAGLAESLRRDADVAVRFEALATLAADHAHDEVARSTIASIAMEDSEELIRMAAARVMEGEEGWRAYVLARLDNTGLSPDERLEPLLLATRSATTPAEVAALRSLVRDSAIARALMDLVTNGWFDPMQLEATADALDLLAQADNTAAYDLLVHMPRRVVPPVPVAPEDGPKPDPERPQSAVSAANLAWLQVHQDIPRARRMLQDIESGRADARMNATIEQMRRAESRGVPLRPPQRPSQR